MLAATLCSRCGSEYGSVRRDGSSGSADWVLEGSDCPGGAELRHDPPRLGRQSVQTLLSFTHLQLAQVPDLLHLQHAIWSGLEDKVGTNAAIGLNQRQAVVRWLSIRWLSIRCLPFFPCVRHYVRQATSLFPCYTLIYRILSV